MSDKQKSIIIQDYKYLIAQARQRTCLYENEVGRYRREQYRLRLAMSRALGKKI